MRHLARQLLWAAALLALTGCVGNPQRLTPDHWVAVIDSDTGQPVPGVPLMYIYLKDIKERHFPNSLFGISDPYLSGADGRAFVPGNEIMDVGNREPSSHTSWRLDYAKTYGHETDWKKSSDIDTYYVKPR